MCESSSFNYLKFMLNEHRLANINEIMYFKRVKSCISAYKNDNHIPRKPNVWMNGLWYFVITTKNLQDFEGDSASRYAQVMVLINNKFKTHVFFFYISMRNDYCFIVYFGTQHYLNTFDPCNWYTVCSMSTGFLIYLITFH